MLTDCVLSKQVREELSSKLTCKDVFSIRSGWPYNGGGLKGGSPSPDPPSNAIEIVSARYVV